MAGGAVEHRRLHRSKWSEIQSELLELIHEKLDLADHARFASVCSWWRSVAVENPPINKPLYFALSHEPNHLIRRFVTSFIPSWRIARFIGAGLDGWLVILIDGLKLFLVNKAFNSIILLPPPPLIFFQMSVLCKAVLSSPPSSGGECTVVVNHFCGGVFYCRLGSDKSFTELSNIPHFAEDILFYKGRLYALCYDRDHNTIVIFDHLLNKVSQLVTHSIIFSFTRRLLILGNGILSILAGGPIQFSVHALEGSEPRLVRVNSIGDNFQILISDRYYSLSITTKEHKEFRRPTNYYQDDSGNLVRDPNQANADDPWSLFFFMFSCRGIHNM